MQDPKDLNSKIDLGSDHSEEKNNGNIDGYEELEEEVEVEYSNDESDDYGSSGEKYGWYNGFSDDVIDDAYDGDPEATWNVD